MMKKLLLILALLFASAGAKDDKTITIGATPVPFGEILEFAKPLFAKKGYELKIVEFNDFAIPNVALNDGELDANFFQHKPYLQAFNDNKGTKLVAINSVAIIPMAIYSKSLKSLDELKNGASVSIPNDPSNEDRAFELLQKAKLITMKATKDFKSPADIATNPKKLKFRELEAAQLPRSLDDVDIALINANYALDFGLNPTKDSIFVEDKNSPYAVFVVVREKDAQSAKTKAINEILRSKEVKEFILKKYSGNVVPTF